MRWQGYKEALVAGVLLAILNFAAWRLGLNTLSLVRWGLVLVSTVVYVYIGKREGARDSTGAGMLGMLCGLIPGLFVGVPMTEAQFQDPHVISTLAHNPPADVRILILAFGVLGSTFWGGIVAYLFGRPISQRPSVETKPSREGP